MCLDATLDPCGSVSRRGRGRDGRCRDGASAAICSSTVSPCPPFRISAWSGLPRTHPAPTPAHRLVGDTSISPTRDGWSCSPCSAWSSRTDQVPSSPWQKHPPVSSYVGMSRSVLSLPRKRSLIISGCVRIARVRSHCATPSFSEGGGSIPHSNTAPPSSSPPKEVPCSARLEYCSSQRRPPRVSEPPSPSASLPLPLRSPFFILRKSRFL